MIKVKDFFTKTGDVSTRAMYFIHDVALPWIVQETGMQHVTEGSPWHRERSVYVHTSMVIQSYFTLAQKFGLECNDTRENFYVGAMAATFHDAGKPDAEQTLHSESRGEYRQYKGHEALSVKYWLDFALEEANRNILTEIALDGDATRYGDFVSKVAYIIEMHLPFGLKKPAKLQLFANTLVRWNIVHAFMLAMMADQMGRIADDQEEKLQRVDEWVSSIDPYIECAQTSLVDVDETKPRMIMMVGLPGSGKSTFKAQSDYESASLDDMRLEVFRKSYRYDETKYGSNPDLEYADAFQMITENNMSKGVEQMFRDNVSVLFGRGQDFVVDNTNLSRKKRALLITQARQNGFTPIAVHVMTHHKICIDRQATRPDKSVPAGAIIQMMNRYQVPTLGEFDEIITIV